MTDTQKKWIKRAVILVCILAALSTFGGLVYNYSYTQGFNDGIDHAVAGAGSRAPLDFRFGQRQ